MTDTPETLVKILNAARVTWETDFLWSEIVSTHPSIDRSALDRWSYCVSEGVMDDPQAIPTTDGRLIAYYETSRGWYIEPKRERAEIEHTVSECMQTFADEMAADADAEWARRDWGV